MVHTSTEEFVGKKMAEYKVRNPVIFDVLNQALSDKKFINKAEVMECLIKILEKIKSQGILTLELIITPETSEQVNKENQDKNLYQEFLEELKRWGEIEKDLAIQIGLTLTLKISAAHDQKKAREYMGIILKNIRLEREK